MTNRRCGDCTLCCRLVPVSDGIKIGDGRKIPILEKPANTRCKYQRHTGCSIYRVRPTACQIWSCLWLLNKGTENLSRPDRSHYVIDMAPDYSVLIDNETGKRTNIPVIQVWVDPNYPDAHRDPNLREYISKRADAEGCAALIRYDSRDGFLLVPPALNTEGVWIEKKSNFNEPEHTAAQIAEVVHR